MTPAEYVKGRIIILERFISDTRIQINELERMINSGVLGKDEAVEDRVSERTAASR